MCKQNKTFVKAFLFVVLVSVLLACTVPPSQTSSGIESITPSSTYAENTATLVPVPTYTSTIGPTQTSTQVPALVSHEWIPQDPLIIFGDLAVMVVVASSPTFHNTLSYYLRGSYL
jgi:hypothetical protein